MRSHVSRYLLAAVLTAVWLTYACGDGATEPPPPDPSFPTTVTVSPATAELDALGATAQMTAEVRDQNGQAMSGVALTWASSDDALATVDASGLVTAVGNGTATITATAGAASGNATLTVAQRVSAVAVSPVGDTLVEADTVRLSAEATDANGHAVAGAGFAWASGDTAVAVVDTTGLVTGVAAGEAEVMATSLGVTGVAGLTVVEPQPTSVAVKPDTLEFTALGQTAKLAAEVRDQIGRAMEGVAVSWASSDAAVAVVDSTGLVTAVGSGSAMVTAMADSVSGSAAVKVVQTAGSVTVVPTSADVPVGDTLRLRAEAFDANGHAVAGTEVTWSSDDVSVAMVDAAGLVRGVAEGTATITAAVDDARGISEITVESPDRAALVALYNATDGPNWVKSENWLTDAPLGEWYGVSTDGWGRVVGLDLAGQYDSGSVSHGLRGRIPSEIGQLKRLRQLNLRSNDLDGPIPPEIGQLVNLVWLDVQLNSLSGPIPPELGDLASLEVLTLRNNNFAGPIPLELGGLTTLRDLSLAWNGTSSGGGLTGPVPPELGKLINLSSLDLSGNELSGPIPPDLARLVNLRYLNLQYNELSGPVPSGVGQLLLLERLYLNGNNLSGPVPREFTRLGKLGAFRFDNNESLCVPGTSGFVDWLRGIEARPVSNPVSGPYCNAADVVVLDSLYSATAGSGWRSSDGWLDSPALAEWHGVQADSLGRVTALDLTANALSGELPRDLGLLASLTELRVGDNSLTGRLPSSLIDLPLVLLHYGGTGLCAPSEPSFLKWLNGIASHEGTRQCAPLSDREILELLYAAAGGSGWLNKSNWLSPVPLGRWHGVTTDEGGRVVRLVLRSNNLSGSIPLEMGGLANLEALDLAAHDLSGTIPPELGNLTQLRSLNLRADFFLSDGLSGPIPPELGQLSSLRHLDLRSNTLSGKIPPELGNLANLQWLSLESNALSGAMPPQLGSLANLLLLDISQNRLSGAIPPQLGSLANLRELRISENRLSGAIPPQLGSLAKLRELGISENRLSGPIPPQLGGLDSLRWLYLNENSLSNPVPPELGDLANLLGLYLDNNALSGSLPAEIGQLANLRELGLGNNVAISGALPATFVDLHELEALQTGGTGLCAPAYPAFSVWLDGVPKHRIATCAAGTSMAYLTQAVQSREFPVPLVAGEDALLRVFVTAAHATGAGLPPVRARFHLNGREIHMADIPATSVPIPTEIEEGSLRLSANAVIPGHAVQPGLEMVIDVDPDGTVDPGLGVARRIPEMGQLALDVRKMPLFDLTVIPFVWTSNPDSTVIELTREMARDPEGHELLATTRKLLPVEALDVTAHAPVASSSNGITALLDETELIRVMEGGSGHYMGMMSGDVDGGGQAHLPGRASFSRPHAGIIAHELGHNMNLSHAPCGGALGPDRSYPYPNGTIGTWGYDFDRGGLVSTGTRDLMGYCGPIWISDYHFTNALRFRLHDEGSPTLPVQPRSTRTVMVWGGADSEGNPYLEPAFIVDVPPVLPDSAGDYVVTGRAGDGHVLFSLSFHTTQVADGDGRSSFAFAVPASTTEASTLASVTLSGPGGTATLDGSTNRPMAILRDLRSGQVRGILRDLPGDALPQADVVTPPGQGLEMLFSRGIPDAAAWRR